MSSSALLMNPLPLVGEGKSKRWGIYRQSIDLPAFPLFVAGFSKMAFGGYEKWCRRHSPHLGIIQYWIVLIQGSSVPMASYCPTNPISSNEWPQGKQWVLFLLYFNVSLSFASGNIKGLGETKLTASLGASHLGRSRLLLLRMLFIRHTRATSCTSSERTKI